MSFLKTFMPEKYDIFKREGERALLIQQLERNIEVNNEYRKVKGRNGDSFAKHTHKLKMQEKFLEEIKSCPVQDFETVAMVWMAKMKRIKV